MNNLDLFAGIGGFALGMERAGFKTAAFCEIEPYCKKVLAKHWPEVPIYDDVRELSASRLASDGIRIDTITGGFPCQDISVAGRQAGIEGERSGLWAEIARLIGELQPRYAIMENVTNLISGDRGRWFGRVLGDLAEIGYDAEWHCIPASAIGAKHHRDRVWIVAYPSQIEWQRRAEKQGVLRTLPQDGAIDCNASRRGEAQNRGCWAVKPSVGFSVDGLSRRLDEIGGLSEKAKANAREALSAMRNSVWQEAYEWAAGRFHRVSEAQILLSILCEYERQQDGGRSSSSSKADASAIMRGLWVNIETARTSLQPRCDGQFATEYSNALCQLSHHTPSQFQTVWRTPIWENGVSRVANGIPNRSHRLKCLGNAVVPQIPELIGRAIMNFEQTKMTY